MIRYASTVCNTLIGKNTGERNNVVIKVAGTLTAVARDSVLACPSGVEVVLLHQEKPQSHESGCKRKAPCKPLSLSSKTKCNSLYICTNVQPPFEGRIISKTTCRFILIRRNIPVKPVMINMGVEMF